MLTPTKAVGELRLPAAAEFRDWIYPFWRVQPAGLVAWAGLSAVCLVVGAILMYPEAIQSPASDTGMFATYGAMLLQGARPYVDFWDLHPPLVFAYWALLQVITGSDWLRTCPSIESLTPPSCMGLFAHGMDLLLSVLTALVVGGIARRTGGSAGVIGVAALLVVGFADQVMLSQEGNNPSTLTLLPSSLAVWAYLRYTQTERGWPAAILAGVTAAIAGLAKQPALLTLAALVGYAAWRRDRTGLAGLLIGTGAALGLACAALAAVGSLDGFIAQAWVYNVERALVGYFVHPVQAPVITVTRVLLESGGVLVVLAILGGVRIARVPLRPGTSVLAWWGLFNLVAVTVFREFVYVVPSFAVLGAFGWVYLWRQVGAVTGRNAVRGRGMLLVSCAASLVLTTSFERVQFARARFERGPGAGPSVTEEIGRRVRQEFPLGRMFIYGNGAEMYLLSGRLPATQYVNAEALRTTAPNAAATRAELIATLQANPPPVVVLAPHRDEAELNLAEYPAMRAFLRDCYAHGPANLDLDPNWTILVHTGGCESSI
jgi:hypothetical protein